MEQIYCQSCGMPLTEPEGDYCIYCFKDGAFTQEMSMEEMIAHCAQFVDEFNNDSEQKMTKEEAIAQMRVFFPLLKRWKTEN